MTVAHADYLPGPFVSTQHEHKADLIKTAGWLCGKLQDSGFPKKLRKINSKRFDGWERFVFKREVIVAEILLICTERYGILVFGKFFLMEVYSAEEAFVTCTFGVLPMW